MPNRTVIHNFPFWLTATCIIIIISIIVLMDSNGALAMSSNNRSRASAVIERRLKRLDRIKKETTGIIPQLRKEIEQSLKSAEEKIRVALKGFDRMIEDTKHELCTLGAIAHCPVEPVPKVVLDGNVWNISKYYTPVPKQNKYFWMFIDRNRKDYCARDNLRWIGYRSRVKGDYSADACMNIQGDGFKTADGSDLRLETPFRVVACPPEYPFGTKFDIEDFGIATCLDRGGAIIGKRLDIWVGVGSQGMDNYISSPSSGKKHVTIIR